jgi:arylsulfatase A-like enzyme
MEGVKDFPAYLAPSLSGVTDVDWVRAQYDGEVAFADDQVGRLLAQIDNLGLTKDTLVVVTADHGEGLGEEAEWFNHGDWLFDHDLHVPLVIRFPGRIQARTQVAEPVELADLAPTILSYVGLPPSGSHTGVDLRPAIEGGRALHTVARAICFDRESNRASRKRDPKFPPTWRMASVRSANDRLIVREAGVHLYRVWSGRGGLWREVLPESLDPTWVVEAHQIATDLLGGEVGRISDVASDRERAALEALGYVEAE